MRRSPSVVVGLTACDEETSLTDGKIASSYARSIPFMMGAPGYRGRDRPNKNYRVRIGQTRYLVAAGR